MVVDVLETGARPGWLPHAAARVVHRMSALGDKVVEVGVEDVAVLGAVASVVREAPPPRDYLPLNHRPRDTAVLA